MNLTHSTQIKLLFWLFIIKLLEHLQIILNLINLAINIEICLIIMDCKYNSLKIY